MSDKTITFTEKQLEALWDNIPLPLDADFGSGDYDTAFELIRESGNYEMSEDREDEDEDEDGE